VRQNFGQLQALFPALLGRDGLLPEPDFAALTDWALSIALPPNPVRALDGSLSAQQAAGRELYFGRRGQQDQPCITCHSIDPALGFFGTRGQIADVGQGQNFKVPHLRNQYDKVGMFGRTDDVAGLEPQGEQVRGSGTRHDGSNASVAEFLARPAFDLMPEERVQVADFLNVFPANLAPIVGQQVTLHADSGPDSLARVTLLIERARTPFPTQNVPQATECDLVASGRLQGEMRSFQMLPDGSFQDDLGAVHTTSALLAQARLPGQELTFTCTYPGGGNLASGNALRHPAPNPQR